MFQVGKIPNQEYNSLLTGKNNAPVETVETPDYKLTNNFSWNVGGVTGKEAVGGVYGVGRTTPEDFYVQGINGDQISYANSKGQVGLTEMKEGPGEHYDPLLGHANHKTWLVA